MNSEHHRVWEQTMFAQNFIPSAIEVVRQDLTRVWFLSCRAFLVS